jgi:hypothetical protein
VGQRWLAQWLAQLLAQLVIEAARTQRNPA